MNHLIIVAHPNPQSFGKGGIVDTLQKTSEGMGVATRVRDLYEIGFDPILKPSDFEALQSGKIPEDIQIEQEQLKWAEMQKSRQPTFDTGAACFSLRRTTNLLQQLLCSSIKTTPHGFVHLRLPF